jgi:carboxylesterase type B
MASGSAINPWSISKNPRKMANKLGGKVGCPSGTSEELLKCLLEKSPEEILKASLTHWFVDPVAPFSVVIEPSDTPDSTSFLSKSPYQLLKEGAFAKVPIIIGINELEGAYTHTAGQSPSSSS